MKKLTYEVIKSWDPCYDPIKCISIDWEGTALDILKIEQVPVVDRFWVVLRTAVVSDKSLRLFAVYSYRQTLKFVKDPDPRSIKAADVAEAYALGKATSEELASAESTARSAVWSAARSAESAARSAESTARSAVWSAARSAESAAWSAESAARSAVWSAVWSAESAARSAESAVWSAAWSAESAARSAESTARSAVWSAARSAAESAAESAKRSFNEDLKNQLVQILTKEEESEV